MRALLSRLRRIRPLHRRAPQLNTVSPAAPEQPAQQPELPTVLLGWGMSGPYVHHGSETGVDHDRSE